MSRVLSFRDLQLIPELGGLTEIELLEIARDGLVNDYLAQLGFNVLSPILYVPAKHRDLQGGVGVGFRAVGEITTSESYLDNPLCTQVERLIITGLKDMSLTRELAKMMGAGVDYYGAINAEDENFPPELIEEDAEEVLDQMELLVMIRDEIRGTPYNEWGSLKTEEEYQQ